MSATDRVDRSGSTNKTRAQVWGKPNKKMMQGDTVICFTEVWIHHVHHVWILLSVEEAYGDHKVKLSPPFHYMTMCPRGTQSLLQLVAAHHKLGS